MYQFLSPSTVKSTLGATYLQNQNKNNNIETILIGSRTLIHFARGFSTLYWYFYSRQLLCPPYAGRIEQVEVVNGVVMWSPPQTTGGEITAYIARIYYFRPGRPWRATINLYHTEREWVPLPELPSDRQLFVQVI